MRNPSVPLTRALERHMVEEAARTTENCQHRMTPAKGAVTCVVGSAVLPRQRRLLSSGSHAMNHTNCVQGNVLHHPDSCCSSMANNPRHMLSLLVLPDAPWQKSETARRCSQGADGHSRHLLWPDPRAPELLRCGLERAGGRPTSPGGRWRCLQRSLRVAYRYVLVQI
jgi:hypothetical protein